MLRWHTGADIVPAFLAPPRPAASRRAECGESGAAAEAVRAALVVVAMAILALGGASACGGARPSKYYELELPSRSPVVATNPYPVTLLVGHISAPDLLRGDRLVFRTGPGQMGTYEYERWAERPTEMLEAMLVRTLRNSGRFRSVQRAGSNARGDFILRGHLARLEEVDDASGISASVVLELELFRPATGETVWYATYSHDEPVASKAVPAVVQGLDRNVQEGLQQLSGDLLQYFADHPVKMQRPGTSDKRAGSGRQGIALLPLPFTSCQVRRRKVSSVRSSLN